VDEKNIELLVREVLQSLGGNALAPSAGEKTGGDGQKLSVEDFPLQEKRPELIRSKTGKKMEELTLEALMKGQINFEDFRTDPGILEYQAQIAEAAGRPQLAQNLRRAMELTALPDEEVLSLYNSLRPYRSSKAQLLGYAEHLEKTYQAIACAKLFREAAEVYEKRGMLA